MICKTIQNHVKSVAYFQDYMAGLRPEPTDAVSGFSVLFFMRASVGSVLLSILLRWGPGRGHGSESTGTDLGRGTARKNNIALFATSLRLFHG